jgi:protein-tyrosine kinase
MSSIEKAINKLKAHDNEEVQHTSQIGVPRVDHKNVSSRFVNLNLAQLRANGYVTHDLSETQIIEEYRDIKRPLLQNAFGLNAAMIDSGNLVMITSALPNEGKTFTSVNLAMSIARERDKTVLLVDADVSKAGISSTLGFEPGLGLSDYLSGSSITFDQIVIKTNVPKLAVISAGNKRSDMTELLTSVHMRQFANELSGRYPDRIILFDSPPLLATSEAKVLAECAGQIIMVVEAESTPTHAIQEALSCLDSSKVIGLVLNKSRSAGKSAYGYGYGYGREE